MVRSVVTVERWWQDDPRERYWLRSVIEQATSASISTRRPRMRSAGHSGARPATGGRRRRHRAPLRSCSARDRCVVLDCGSGLGGQRCMGGAWNRQAAGISSPTSVRGFGCRFRGVLPPRPLTLEAIRVEQARLDSIRAGRPYFPFELGGRATRPLQGYLFKLPAAFMELFPELEDIPASPVRP